MLKLSTQEALEFMTPEEIKGAAWVVRGGDGEIAMVKRRKHWIYQAMPLRTARREIQLAIVVGGGVAQGSNNPVARLLYGVL